MFSHIKHKSEILQFAVSSGILRVTDPCYGLDVWCSGQIENVKTGTWLAQVGYFKDPHDADSVVEYRQHQREDELAVAKAMNKADPEHSALHDEMAKKRIERMERKWAEEDANDHGRVAYIRVCHESEREALENGLQLDAFEKTNVDVGVDSGQAGFFELSHYAEALSGKPSGRQGDEKFEEFYDGVCELTLAAASFGVVPFGAVSQSGYGDGGYDCFVRLNEDGQTVDSYIVFIGEDDVDNESENEFTEESALV